MLSLLFTPGNKRRKNMRGKNKVVNYSTKLMITAMLRIFLLIF